VEIRYTTIEREFLVIIRLLAEVRWLVVGSKYLIKIYINHFVLESILRTGDVYKKITRWMNRFSKYNYKIYYRPCIVNVMRIIDGISRMSGIYQQALIVIDSE